MQDESSENTMSLSDYVYIFVPILLNAYTQLVFKWQSAKSGPIPADSVERFMFFVGLVFNPWIISALIATFVGMLGWLAALSKFPLNFVYPFVSLTFILVLLGSAVFFHESVSTPKLIGFGFIVVGILFISQG